MIQKFFHKITKLFNLTNNDFSNNSANWKKFEEPPSSSFHDYIYQQLTLNNLSPDLFFAFLELFWPTFVSYKQFIFLKDNFSEEKYEQNSDRNEKMTEYWMNLVIIDPYFENTEDGNDKAEFLAKKLAEIWRIKLKNDFPHLEFVVECFSDEEAGDYGLTFYQKFLS